MNDDHNELDPTELPSTETVASSTGDQRQIGPYQLLQKLGEGGMGEVWLAEQSRPVKRRVALKIIKRGMDSKHVVARFEAERQALALMDHPAVAKVFDAGTTPRGRPYFVMEYVKGVPITKHCDRHKLTNRERLDLFMQVCEGVQHAHQKAIIHRDLKPSNLLVTEQEGKRFPKIIDFGVAKATAQKLTEKTMFTELGVLIGTPEYMSPEQAELTGEDVDTRTDVYSLGVILYELLVGALPFDSKELRSGGFEGIRRKINDEEPLKPSARLSSLGVERSQESAARRRADLPVLRNQLRGDLDWIVMRAMDKDRTRRYGSPAELAADVARHLKYEPVLAGPPSAIYRARKFVRRHRVGVGVATIGVVVLISFAAMMVIQAARISAERDRANRERAASDRVSEFLANMLGDVDPHVMGGALWRNLRERVVEAQEGRGATEADIGATLANLDDALAGVNATDAALQLLDEQVLARAGETIERELAKEPRIAGKLEHTLGKTYLSLGLYELAERHVRRALEIREEAFGTENADALRSKKMLGKVYCDRGNYPECEVLYRETLDVRRRVLGEGHADTIESLRVLAWACGRQGRYAEANAYRKEALQLCRKYFGAEHPSTLKTLSGLAFAYNNQGRYADAEAVSREALELLRRVLGEDHPETFNSERRLAVAVQNQGRYKEAGALYEQSLARARRTVGEDHLRKARLIYELANLYMEQSRYTEAEALQRESLEMRRRIQGENHPALLWPMRNLAWTYSKQGRHPEAEALQHEALELSRRVMGESHPETIRLAAGLAYLCYEEGRYLDGELIHLETLASARRLLGEDHRDTVEIASNLAGAYEDQGRYTAAEAIYRGMLDNDHPGADMMLFNLSRLAAVQGQTSGALDLLRQAVDKGFSDSERIGNDSNLAALNGRPEFDVLLERARQNAEIPRAE